MQLVLSGKNIVAYGEGFLAMGGTVINPDTGAVHQNATIVECENCPADLGKVGYEYHAGEFVPCGPFGEGDGNIAVWCDECKAPRDSGLKVSEMGKIFHTTYKGTGTTSCSVTCGFRPKYIIISDSDTSYEFFCVLNAETGGGMTFCAFSDLNAGNPAIVGVLSCTANDTGATWTLERYCSKFSANSSMQSYVAMNYSKTTYAVTVFG